ncbi:MAG: ribulose-phosphate 3-epimerase [Phycisphaerae bacterium]|nr:ribulose-phosphate 3-epimerase [Phycisphaerae bacterium]MDW8261629.1 ribulose-phosphate 3-epimerase [Phycisphaerales bacterium]
MASPFFDPTPKIQPSILSADFAHLADDLADAQAAGGDFPHIDVMDGHLVPNLAIGVPIVEKLRKASTSYFDVHLMIDAPITFAAPFVKAGAQNITFHVEAPEVAGDVAAAARKIRRLGCNVGITLKPRTPIEAVFPALQYVDLVLIMSVEPGFGGQKFMPAMLEKARRVRPLLKPHQKLQIDGGIGPSTIRQARAAGVDWFVVGSALFEAKDRKAAIARMRAEIEAASQSR